MLKYLGSTSINVTGEDDYCYYNGQCCKGQKYRVNSYRKGTYIPTAQFWGIRFEGASCYYKG